MADEPTPAPVKRRPVRRRLHGSSANTKTTPPATRIMSNNNDDDFFSLTNPIEEQKAKAVAEKIISSEIAKITKTSISSPDLNDEDNNVIEVKEKPNIAAEEDKIKEDHTVVESITPEELESKKRSNSIATDTSSDLPEDTDDEEYRPTKQRKFKSEEVIEVQRSNSNSDDNIEELEVVTKEVVPESLAVYEETADFKEVEEIDPELAERIRQRKAQLKALQDKSFPVGIIIKTLIPGLETTEPFVSPQTSATTFGVIKRLYMKSVFTYFENDPTSFQYVRENSVLVWNNTIVFDVATPHSVGVKKSEASMLLYAMFKEDYEKNRQAELEAKLVRDNVDYDELLNQEEEKLLAQNRAALLQQRQQSVQAEEGYFPILMKSKDNQVIKVQVNADTKISKLADYYRKQRNIDSTTKIRLSFDDEDMDLSQTVGDTELEEDFTIDVFLD